MVNLKRHLVIFGKVIGFITSWVLFVLICSLPTLDQFSFLANNSALLRLWWELLPLVGTLLITGVFVYMIEKNRIKVSLIKNPLKSTIFGLIFGYAWLGGTLLILFFMGVLQLGDKNTIPYLTIWFLAVLLNASMQEYLVRGYLFSLLKKQYNTIVAIIITTILFTAMHGGAFEAGIVAVLNVITMSVLVSLLLVYTENLLVPIIVHFIWNGIGCIVFGVVSLAEDYPNIWNCTLAGNNLVSGGSAKIEGSIVVLFVNVILITFMMFLLKKQSVKHNP